MSQVATRQQNMSPKSYFRNTKQSLAFGCVRPCRARQTRERCDRLVRSSAPSRLEAGTAWIYADQAKGGRDIHVSLNETALIVLRRQLGKHPVRVFTYRGQPYNRAYTKAWQTALRRAGIENFRWHDIRHTWASWLAQKGVSLSDIQEMGGWETPSMVQRYAHLSPAHLAHRAKLLDGLIDTNSAQRPRE